MATITKSRHTIHCERCHADERHPACRQERKFIENIFAIAGEVPLRLR